MSEHTEEPWEVEVNDLRGGRYYTVRRPGREDIDIHEEDGGAEDAPVIAAAPELLGALEVLLDVFKRCEAGHAPSVEERFAAREAAERVIAKAKGREHD